MGVTPQRKSKGRTLCRPFDLQQMKRMRLVMKLLIVEDNAGMRRFIKSLVQDFADDILECNDGAEALPAYKDFLPDWVLMDIQMPGMDGLTAGRQIKTAFPEANICIVTDYGDEKTREAARAAGACAYIVKEELHTLRSVISRATEA
jgi:CheY-like chemotaxis protein